MKSKIIGGVAAVLCLLAVISIFWFTQNIDDSKENDSSKLVDETIDLGFYQKIKDKETVDVLVLGDSIGANSGASQHTTRWDIKFKDLFLAEYGISMNLNNVSVPGTDTMFGIIKVNQEINLKDYDLVILCFGQNDNEAFINTYYEALIRTIRKENKDIEIISILESSQKDYTPKIDAIISLAEAYKLPVADTIAAYKNQDVDYESLTVDGIHPNDAGYELYASEILNAIKQKMNSETVGIMLAEPINSDCIAFENYSFISMKEFEEKKYSLSIDATGIGMYYFLSPNGGKYSVTINDKVNERDNTTQYSDKESYELYYWNTTMQSVTINLKMDKNVDPKTFIGVFYFSNESQK